MKKLGFLLLGAFMTWAGCSQQDERVSCEAAKDHLRACVGHDVPVDPSASELCDGESAEQLLAMSCEELELFKTIAKADDGNACELSELCYGVGFLQDKFCKALDPYCQPLTPAEIAEAELGADSDEDGAGADSKEDSSFSKIKKRCKEKNKTRYRKCKENHDKKSEDKKCTKKWNKGKTACSKADRKRRKCEREDDDDCDDIKAKNVWKKKNSDDDDDHEECLRKCRSKHSDDNHKRDNCISDKCGGK